MGKLTVCHAFAALHFWFGCFYDWNYVKIPSYIREEDEELSFVFKSKLKYLTFWDAVLQGLFFTISVLNDLIGSNDKFPKKTPLIRKIKDLLLCSLAFPVAMFVGLTFWGLYFVDRELVFPKVLDPFFPVWLNHVMHTNIMIFILIEMYSTYRSYPSRKLGLSILIIFKAIYLVWIHIIKSQTGQWVYPVLNVLNLPMRIVFFVGLLSLSVVLYITGEKLNGILWRQKAAGKKRS